jgi:aryl-alcohol dehydrogenase-like predicted oxidoreductase
MSEIALPKTKLGATDWEVSRLGLGGFHQVEVSSEIVDQVVTAYLEVGGNYIETARAYGDGASEEKIGRALEGGRDQVILVSKSGSRDADGMRRDLEASLRALRTDHIEIYFLHCVNLMDEFEIAVGPGGALSALLRAKEEGLISGIGFSSHRPPQLYREAIERIPLDVILIWDNYLENLYLPEIRDDIYPLAREKGVGITVMKPLADGFLYRSAEAAFRYALCGGAEMLVSGTKSPEQVRQAAAAICKGPLSAEEQEAALRDAPELGRYVCRQCGACSANLMALFRLEGYIDRQMLDYLPHNPADYSMRVILAPWFTMAEVGRQRFAEREWDVDALAAEAGTVDCPYQIDVGRKLRLAVAKLQDKRPDLA